MGCMLPSSICGNYEDDIEISYSSVIKEMRNERQGEGEVRTVDCRNYLTLNPISSSGILVTTTEIVQQHQLQSPWTVGTTGVHYDQKNDDLHVRNFAEDTIVACYDLRWWLQARRKKINGIKNLIFFLIPIIWGTLYIIYKECQSKVEFTQLM